MALENAPLLSVSLVGRFGLRLNGQPVELRTRKAAAVLSYLALSETKHESRERLVGLLWSRSDEEKARASLRQVVRELRSALEDGGFTGFVAERLVVGIDIGQVEVDIENVLVQAENEQVHPLLLDAPALDDRLLEGMDDLDPSFRVWVLAKRQTIHERLMRSLEAGLVGATVSRDIRKKFAAAIVNLDPTHEHACRYLMRSHAEDGDIAGALRIYKSLWDLLERDYGMEPSPQTEELVANIKLGVFDSSPADFSAHAWSGGVAARDGSQPTALPNAPLKTVLVLRPFRAARHRRRPRPSGSGLLPTSCCMPRQVPRVERRRSRAGRSGSGIGPAILHRDDRLSSGRRNQHRDGAEGRDFRHLCLERKLSRRSQQLVRDPAADHSTDCDLAERAAIGRTADASCR